MRSKLYEPYEEFVKVFERSLMSSGRSETTIKFYTMKARAYLRFVLGEGRPPFTRRAVEAYLASLRSRGDNGSTLRVQFYVLKALFSINEKNSEWTFKSSDAPKLPSVKRRPIFTQSDMNAIESKAYASGSLRNYALVRLADTIGVRRIELREMNIKDVHLRPEEEYSAEALARLTPEDKEYLEHKMFHPHVHVRTFKGGNLVERELDEETARALAAHIKTRLRPRVFKGKKKYGDEDALFVAGRNGHRLSLGSLSRIIRDLKREALIGKSHAGYHASRRGRITSLYLKGVKRNELVAEWGWRSASTVDTYILPDVEEVKKRIREVHPYFTGPSDK